MARTVENTRRKRYSSDVVRFSINDHLREKAKRNLLIDRKQVIDLEKREQEQGSHILSI